MFLSQIQKKRNRDSRAVQGSTDDRSREGRVVDGVRDKTQGGAPFQKPRRGFVPLPILLFRRYRIFVGRDIRFIVRLF